LVSESLIEAASQATRSDRNEEIMGKNSKQTGAKAAKAASKTLSSKTASKTAKTAAASALSQTPSRRTK
jgi:hypothetical protein